MGILNYDDVQRQLESAGLVLKSGLQIGTAKPVRCRVEGADKESRGWYRLYEMPLDSGDSLIVGSFGVWQGNDNGAIKVELPKLDRPRLTSEQVEALKARMRADREAAQAQQAQQHERAAARASVGWAKCQREGGANAYLTRKGLPPGKLYGARLSPSGNLVVPIVDERGKVWGLQVVYSDPAAKQRKGRDKEYWPFGMAKAGHWHLIGMIARRSVVLVCEGFATGASLHEATGLPVVVTFDAGSLLPVAKRIAKQHKGARLLVCADDDWLQKCRECGVLTPVQEAACRHCGKPHGTSNAGVTAAAAAAMAVSGAWVMPTFPEQRPADRKGDTDFNDLHVHASGGLHLVARQIEAAIAAQGWAVAARADAAPPDGGEGGSGRRGAVSVMQLDDLVARFIPLDDGTGDHLFDLWSNKVVKTKQAVALLAAGVRWDDVKRHPTWITRGAYYLDQVGFDPSGGDKDVLLNTWQGWPIKPKKGSCSELLDLLWHLCSHEGEATGKVIYDWLLCWMAYPLQNPGAKMSSAVIMHGPQGTGKSTVFQTLAKIYGDYATVLNQRGLEDKFNSDWTDRKLFLLAEEVVTRAEMWHIKNELKELVTGEWLRINTKMVAAYKQRNRINIIYLSNEGQPLPLDNDDRRHLVVWTPQQLDESRYDSVQIELENGGVEAFYQYLLDLDLSGFHPKKKPPMTEAKRELILVSKSSDARFIDEWSEFELSLPVSPARTMDVYAAYVRWCRRNGEMHPANSARFIGTVARRPGWDKRKVRVTNETGSGTKPLWLIFPPDDLLQKYDRAMPVTAKPADWLALCCDQFAAALKDAHGEQSWAA